MAVTRITLACWLSIMLGLCACAGLEGDGSLLLRATDLQDCSCATALELQLPSVWVYDGVHTSTATKLMFHVTVHQLSAHGNCNAATPDGHIIVRHSLLGGDLLRDTNVYPPKLLRPSPYPTKSTAHVPVMHLSPGIYHFSASFLPAAGAPHCASNAGLPLHILPPANTTVSWELTEKLGLQAAVISVQTSSGANPLKAAAPSGRVHAVLRSVADPFLEITRLLDLVPDNSSSAKTQFFYESLGATPGAHDLVLSYLPDKPEVFQATSAVHPAAISIEPRSLKGQPAPDWDSSLGRTFFLEKIDFLHDAQGIVNGKALFAQGYEKCIYYEDDSIFGNRYEEYMDSYEKFTYYVQSTLNVDASTTELQATAKASYNWAREGESKSDLYVLQLVYTHQRYYLDVSCLVDNGIGLTENLWNDIWNLPDPPVDGAEDDYKWQPYMDFIQKWGTQWVGTYYTGATFSQWIKSSENNEMTQSDMKAAACVTMLGTEGTGKQGACADVSAGEREDARDYSFTSRTTAFGGTQELLGKVLRSPVDIEDINAFLESANLATAPAVYIWQNTLKTIKDSTTGTPWYNRAAALEQFYEGFKGYGCEAKLFGSGLYLQYWRVTGFASLPAGDRTSYGCMQHCQGCLSDDDCHNHLGSGYCYGPTCVYHVPPLNKAIINTERINDNDEPPNNGCNWHGGGAVCDIKEKDSFYCRGEFQEYVKGWPFY
ncbi:DELTA-alicitoxin-Pse2b [Coccomyxa sp. Obi]|nr:DELTA-alicitoxin-Pse2b [Coccomyxa sp. Obi]